MPVLALSSVAVIVLLFGGLTYFRRMERTCADVSERSLKPLKIAIVISEFPALNETFVMDHITSLIDRGHSVDIYATAPKGEPKVHDDVIAYDLLGRTTYRDNKKFELPESRFLRLRNAIPLLIKGLRRNPKPCLSSINVLRAGRAAASLSDFYEASPFITRSCDYDIIHCHFPPNGELLVRLRKRGLIRGKIITSFHGYNLPHFQSGRIWDLYGNLAKDGDLFILESDHMKRWYEDHGWGKGRTILHRNPVGVKSFPQQRRREYTGGAIRILSIGRLVEKKGFEYAISGVAQIIKKFPNIEYDIVGDGEERPALEQLIADLGAQNNIKLVGWRERTELLRCYQNADIFLIPSVTSKDGDQEGIPVSLQEAMAAGLPAIGTYHTGIPELIQDRESGFLVNERDSDAIADRLTYLMEHPESLSKMGQEGRRRIEEIGDLRRLVGRLEEIYRLMIADDYRALQKLV